MYIVSFATVYDWFEKNECEKVIIDDEYLEMFFTNEASSEKIKLEQIKDLIITFKQGA